MHWQVAAARFFDCLGLCISHSSQFSGSMDKLIVSKPLSLGYLYSVAELKSGAYLKDRSHSSQYATSSSIAPKISVIQDDGLSNAIHGTVEYELPHVPPWFVHASSQRLYFALAGIVRLVGLSTVSGNLSTTLNACHTYDLGAVLLVGFYSDAIYYTGVLTCHVVLLVMMLGQGTSASLSVFVDILLNQFRRLSTELRAKDTQRFGVQRWYMKSDSGQLLRQASSAVCMLNELIYGLSDQSLCICLQLFNKGSAQVVRVPGQDDNLTSCAEHGGVTGSREVWKISEQMGTKQDIIHCIGSILHEYMSPEVWDLPTEQNSELCQGEISLPLHLFRDTTALQQVIMHHCNSSIVLLKFFLSFVPFHLYFMLCSASGYA